MSWRVVEAKWDGFKTAFHGFDPARVASMTARDVDRLGRDQRIIRNVPKIKATVDNARTLVNLDKDKGGFRGYLRSQDGFDATTAALRKQFRFLGDSGTYFFLWSIGEKVPSWDTWHASRERKAPRARKSPTGRSPKK